MAVDEADPRTIQVYSPPSVAGSIAEILRVPLVNVLYFSVSLIICKVARQSKDTFRESNGM